MNYIKKSAKFVQTPQEILWLCCKNIGAISLTQFWKKNSLEGMKWSTEIDGSVVGIILDQLGDILILDLLLEKITTRLEWMPSKKSIMNLILGKGGQFRLKIGWQNVKYLKLFQIQKFLNPSR